MSGNQTNPAWQVQLVARYPTLFNQEFNGRVTAPGYPAVNDGWRDLVETAIGRIASAVTAAPTGSLKIGQIKEKFGTLRLYLDNRSGLPEATCAGLAARTFTSSALCRTASSASCPVVATSAKPIPLWMRRRPSSESRSDEKWLDSLPCLRL
jgi:hypothetical protein